MSWHHASIHEILEKFQTTKNGLSDQQAAENQTIYGWNEIPDSTKRHWISILIKQFKSLLIFILFLAALISWFTGHEVDTYVIFAVILINAFIGFVQELKAERAVASLKTIIKTRAKAIRNGKKRTLNARELVPGDLIILEEGDSVPADARLLNSKNLRTIEAPLTGESVPVEKNTGTLPESTPLADRKNMVFKGTFIAGGYAEAIVTGTGMRTALGEIAETLQTIAYTETNFQKKTNTLAKQMGIIALGSALLLFIVAYFFQDSPLDEILMIAIAALVSAIPEGLPAVLAIVLAIGAANMTRRKAIVREFSATETLGAVTTIITDKTGTLTQNTLTVRKIFIPGQEEMDVTGEGWSPIGNFIHNGQIIDPEQYKPFDRLLKIAGWSNNSDIIHDQEKDSYTLIGDPTEGALLALARKGGIFPKKDTTVCKIDDLPFNSTLKMRASLIEENNTEKTLLVVGAPEKILDHCTHLLHGNTVTVLDKNEKKRFQEVMDQWSEQAMRVIALAYKEMGTDDNQLTETDITHLTFCGFTGMIDPPRPDVKDAIKACKKAGIRVIMATGDHIKTAVAVAKSVGILDETKSETPLALTETQLLELDEKEFENAISKTHVLARLTPNMKLRIADILQKKGELIAMTGDGVNDAPALKKADVGVAMGIMGTDVARDAAQVVLADDNFSTIVSAIEEGRIVFNNIRQTSFFLITTNFSEIVTLLAAIALGMPVPLTATQILWLNLVTDGTCTTAMATEKGHGDELEQKPVNPKEKILNSSILPFLVINAALMAVLALSVFWWFLPEGIEKARTAAFIVMAFSQLFNVFNMRSIKQSVFKVGFFTNRYINLALVASVIIQVILIEVPFFENLFHFDPISFGEFVVFALLSSLILWVGELYKFINHHYGKYFSREL